MSFYFKRRGAFDTSSTCRRRTRGPSPSRSSAREILAAKEPPIRAVWVTAGNPVAMLPDSATVARAFETRELVVVADSFLTDTARRAHLVLPTDDAARGRRPPRRVRAPLARRFDARRRAAART